MTPEERTQLRELAQSRVGCIGQLHGVYPSDVLALLDALDAAEARVAAAEEATRKYEIGACTQSEFAAAVRVALAREP